jgi:hypothetical protein
MALETVESAERTPIPRQGRIRRCRVRHVSIGPGADGGPPTVQVDCLLGGREYPLPLGTMDEARPICNACTATTVWRADED